MRKGSKMRFGCKEILASCAIALCLFGCNDLPDPKAAMKDAEAIAKSDMPTQTGYVVSDIVRENGWAEGNDYKIRFTYNLVTKVDYPHLIVDTMQFAIQEIKAMPESDRLALQMKVGLSSMMSGLSSDVPDLKKTIDGYVQYPAFVEYFRANKNFANAEEIFGSAVYLTVSMMNEYSIKPDSPAGTKIPRQVTFTYRKTEKGWKKLD